MMRAQQDVCYVIDLFMIWGVIEQHLKRVFLKNGPTPASFSFIYGLFKQKIQLLQKPMQKNFHPVYGARIWTHNLPNMSCHTKPLDQGSRPNERVFIQQR